MSNNKQTAVEWLYLELFYFLNGQSKFEDAEKILERAKKMEKERIIKACDAGFDTANGFIEDIKYKNAEHYYELTYGGNK
jgi:hypothetical protein